MHDKSSLHRLHDSLTPTKDTKERIWKRVESGLVLPKAMHEVRTSLVPDVCIRARIWSRIESSLNPASATALLKQLRVFLTPPEEVIAHVKARLFPQLAPVNAVVRSERRLKWVAAFVLVVLSVHIGPRFFIASPINAESAVVLLPTRGEVSVFMDKAWTTVTNEMELATGMMVRTHDGEASIMLHDDGVIRMDSHTALEIHDITDRAELVQGSFFPTATLLTGRIWVQGLVPPHVRGVTIATRYGDVTVNEGGISIEEDETVDVFVWHHRASVSHEGQKAILVQGERTQMWEGNVLLVKKIPDDAYQRAWPSQNLDRDAVHRRGVAQRQHERRVAQAGILPTSPLYPVKRAAEKVDVLLSFSEESRIQKRLEQATARLNEAAALLTNGEKENMATSLEEYKETLLAVATTGSGQAGLSQFMIQQSLTEMVIDTAASLPGDESYPVKLAVLEASKEFPSGVINAQNTHAVLLIDALTALNEALTTGSIDLVEEAWGDVSPHLVTLKEEDHFLSSEVRKEVMILLAEFALSLREVDEDGYQIASEDLLAQTIMYLPPELEVSVPVLSDEELDTLVQTIRARIFKYNMRQSRVNQFTAELRALKGHPDEGRILRRLHMDLPDGPEHFPDRVRRALIQLRWQKAAE
jgi:hypothetical protein